MPQTKDSKSNYILQDRSTAHCPQCQRICHLLCHDRFSDSKARRFRKPWFFICFTCKKIFEVGQGEVRYETKSSAS